MHNISKNKCVCVYKKNIYKQAEKGNNINVKNRWDNYHTHMSIKHITFVICGYMWHIIMHIMWHNGAHVSKNYSSKAEE